MKLKTLKDLKCLDADHPSLCEDDHTYSGKELKAEAIKWVKQEKEDSPVTWRAMTQSMMDFHNITEENLK